MEEFIAKIYDRSFIIEYLQEYASLTDSGRFSDAHIMYNKAAVLLEKMLTDIAKTDTDTASQIQTIALAIVDAYENKRKAKGLVEGRLIPALYTCMNNFNGINVDAGTYTIMSSDSGFLTLSDNSTGTFLHDTHNPMWEAYRIAQSLYKPEMENFLIFGCGFAYLAYQIYHQSEGAVTIYIYENDQTVLDYATMYGVLSLIPEKNLVIKTDSDMVPLAETFLNDLKSLKSCGFCFESWKRPMEHNIDNRELKPILINTALELETGQLSVINLWKNRKLEHIDFSGLIARFNYDEWIIVSAGPSLDENIAFIRENEGKKGIIAVNTVFRRLIKEGITPNVIAAADQSNKLYGHIEGLEEFTKDPVLIADWLLNWKYASLYRGPICFVRTNASKEPTGGFLPDDPIWDVHGTVSCLAVEAAVHLNAQTVYLVGQDLAYPEGRKYAAGMPHAEAPTAVWDQKVPSVDGGMVETCEAFNWFRNALEYQINKYNNVRFINMSPHGAFIKGTQGRPT